MAEPESLARERAKPSEADWFMQRLQDYLEYLISVGAMSGTEASQIVEEHWSAIYPEQFGLVDRYGTPVPPKRVTDLPFYARTQTWAKQQGESYIKASEKAVSDYEKAVGKWGIESAEVAEYNRQQQEDYQQRVRQQQLGVKTAQREQKARAMAGAFQPEPQDERQVPGMPSAGEAAYPFLENLPEHMQWYFPYSKVMQEFERKQPGARERWWAGQHPETETTAYDELKAAQAEAAKFGSMAEGVWSRAPGIGGFPGENLPFQQGINESLAQYLEQIPMDFQTQMEVGTLRGADIGQAKVAEWSGKAARGDDGGMPLIPSQQDPLKGFLQNYPFLEEFTKLSPRQRGFYPRTYSPPTRWL